MTRRSALLPVASASLLLCLTAGSGAAAATTQARPAVGAATATVELLAVSAGGHRATVGRVDLTSTTLTGGRLGQAVVTPLAVDGITYGQQTVTPASSPVSFPAQFTPSALDGLVSLTSPVLTVTVTNAPSAHLASASLGTLDLLGLGIDLQGSLSLDASVHDAAGALGQQALLIENLALPSIADLLGVLGLDLAALPDGVLAEVVSDLDLVTGAVSAAQSAVDTAQAAVTVATTTVATTTAALATATTNQTTATGLVGTTSTALQALLDQIGTLAPAVLVAAPLAATIAGYGDLVTAASPLLAVIDAALPGTSAAYTAFTAAQAALTTANAAVAAAQAAVDSAQTALTGLTATLTTAVDALTALVTTVLDETPLLTLDRFEVSTLSSAVTAAAGGQQAEVIGGVLEGLTVLGTDVLDVALGSSSLDLLGLTAAAADAITATIGDLTGALSEALSTVPSLPTLSIPAPEISLLGSIAATSVADGFGIATTGVDGLAVTLPAVAIPTGVALPDAADLPALQGVIQTPGLLTSAPVSLGLGQLGAQAAFRPAAAGVVTGPGIVTPGTGPVPTLPQSGLPAGLAVLAVLLTGGAVVLRRRAQALRG